MRRRRKKRSRGRRLYSSRAQRIPASVKKQIAKIAEAHSGPIGHHDFQQNTNPSTSGLVAIASNVTQGDTEGSRQGEETRLLSFRCRWNVTHNAAASLDTFVRVIIFRSMKDQAGSVPGVTDLLQQAEIGGLHNQDNKKFFIVLKDMVIRVNPTSKSRAAGHFYINLRNVKASYNGVSDSNYTRGHLYMLTLSNEATNTPTINFRTRTYFRSV